MLFTNVQCKIKKKKSPSDNKEYSYIQFGDQESGSLFFACNIKGFTTVNVGFHNKLSVGMSKKNNPKIIYSPDDKDLYVLLSSEFGGFLEIKNTSTYEVLASTKIKEIREDGKRVSKTISLIKVIDDNEVVVAVNRNFEGSEDSEDLVRYITIKDKFVKTVDELDIDIEEFIEL